MRVLSKFQSIMATRAVVRLYVAALAVTCYPALIAEPEEGGHHQTLGDSLRSTTPIEFRGYFVFGKRASFSLRDLETGASWWMHLGQERFGFKLEGFNKTDKTIVISWNGQRETVQLKESDTFGGAAVFSSIELSPVMQQIYDLSETLIKTTRSKETGRLVKDHREVEKLRTFIAQNPSVAALHDFLPELGDALDYEEFIKLEFPKGVQSRNKQNTARWGIDKSIDIRDIEKLIASNPTKAGLDAALQRK